MNTANTPPVPTAVIVDDEPLARRKLHDLVEAVPLVRVVGEAADGEAAVRTINELQPDVVFLDIEMPGMSGLDVIERVRDQPVVVFTTAHGRYAVDAFELAAADYLLKPFGSERFRTAVERAVRALAAGESATALERARLALGSPRPLGRIFARDRGRIVPLSLARVERFEAQDDYVLAYTEGRRFLLRVTLQSIHDRVDVDRFVRIHRSHIVNLDFVEAFEPYDAARLLVRMRDGTRILASRTRSRALREQAI